MENATEHGTRRDPGPYRSVYEVRRANVVRGYHFFDPDTLRFFSSRIGKTIYGGRYFVTSERDEPVSSRYPAAWNGERRYTLREALADGSVSTVGDFGAYATGAAARRAAQRLADVEAGKA